MLPKFHVYIGPVVLDGLGSVSHVTILYTRLDIILMMGIRYTIMRTTHHRPKILTNVILFMHVMLHTIIIDTFKKFIDLSRYIRNS